MRLTAVVSGDRNVAARFDRMDDLTLRRMRGVVETLTERLFAAVQPPRRTGRAASEKRMSIEQTADMVRGRVWFSSQGTEAAKIGALEYGAHKSRRPVTEYKRMQSQVFGRAIQPIEVIVDRYRRVPNIAEHRFLRGPLAAMHDNAERQLREAAEGAAREAINA